MNPPNSELLRHQHLIRPLGCGVLNVFKVEGGVTNRLRLEHRLHNETRIPYIHEKLIREANTHLIQDQKIRDGIMKS
jgi:hypothetical protein